MPCVRESFRFVERKVLPERKEVRKVLLSNTLTVEKEIFWDLGIANTHRKKYTDEWIWDTQVKSSTIGVTCERKKESRAICWWW